MGTSVLALYRKLTSPGALSLTCAERVLLAEIVVRVHSARKVVDGWEQEHPEWDRDATAFAMWGVLSHVLDVVQASPVRGVA